MAQTPAGKVFISFSHKDKAYLDKLQDYLTPFVRDGAIPLWVDTQIKPGDDWHEKIKAALAEAQVAILLVSVSFLASKFVAEEELPTLLSAATERGLVVLPVVVTPCLFRRTNLSRFQAVNDPSKPLSGLSEHEQALIWERVVESVLDTLDRQQQKPPDPPKQQEPERAEPAPQPSKSKVQWAEEGEQHLATKRFVEALDCYEQALALDARYVLALRGKSLALFHLDRLVDALASAYEATRLYPKDAEMHYSKGLILKDMKRYDEALLAFSEVPHCSSRGLRRPRSVVGLFQARRMLIAALWSLSITNPQ